MFWRGSGKKQQSSPWRNVLMSRKQFQRFSTRENGLKRYTVQLAMRGFVFDKVTSGDQGTDGGMAMAAIGKFSFFESYHRALMRLPDARYGALVRAMCNYCFNGKSPQFTDDADCVIWELLLPILERSVSISSIRSYAGRKGKGVARNSGNQFARKSIQNQNKSMQNQNGIGKGKGIGEENKESAIAPKKKFSLPSLEERQKSFAETIRPYVEQYGETMCNDFFAYWSEPNRKGDKMRFELEKTWEVIRRLATWKRRGEAKR